MPGAIRLGWTTAEKVVLWKAIQKHNPFTETKQRDVRKRWRKVAAEVIEAQDVEIYTKKRGRETVHVAMHEKTKVWQDRVRNVCKCFRISITKPRLSSSVALTFSLWVVR